MSAGMDPELPSADSRQAFAGRSQSTLRGVETEGRAAAKLPLGVLRLALQEAMQVRLEALQAGERLFDELVKEAEVRSGQILADARADAERIVADARAEADRIVGDALQQSRILHDETVRQAWEAGNALVELRSQRSTLVRRLWGRMTGDREEDPSHSIESLLSALSVVDKLAGDGVSPSQQPQPFSEAAIPEGAPVAVSEPAEMAVADPPEMAVADPPETAAAEVTEAAAPEPEETATAEPAEPVAAEPAGTVDDGHAETGTPGAKEEAAPEPPERPKVNLIFEPLGNYPAAPQRASVLETEPPSPETVVARGEGAEGNPQSGAVPGKNGKWTVPDWVL